jgi:uncharacterized membrane protein
LVEFKLVDAFAGDKTGGDFSMHADPSWMHWLLAVHIAAGAMCLALGPLVLTTVKGSRRHKRWGMAYFWSMAAVAGTALPMALYRPILFLALIAVLSFYLAFSGYRVLRLKNLASGGSAKTVDWAAALLALTACACLVGFALLRPIWVQNMGIVAIVLGALGVRAASADIYRFIHKPTDRMFWLSVHLEKFIGSYIAICTAFSTVTLNQVFPHAGLAIWLWPAAVGVPAIFAASAYYRRSFRTPIESAV